MNITQKKFWGLCATILVLVVSVNQSMAKAKNRLFAGTSLSRFVSQVLELNPRMKAAQAALDSAKSRFRSKKKSLYNPELEVDYERSIERERSAKITQTLDVWGRQRAQRSVALAEVRAAKIQIKVVEQEILVELLRALGEFQIQRGFNNLSRRKLNFSARLAKLAAQRRAAGDINQSQLLVARLNLVTARLAHRNTGSALLKAGRAVSLITGEWRSKWPSVPTVNLTIQRPNLSELENLPILRLARAKFDISRSQITIAERNRRPDPTIGVGVTKNSLETYGSVSLSIPIPILNSFNAEVLAAASTAREQEFNANEIRRRSRMRLLSSHALLRNAAKAWGSWKSGGRNVLRQQNRLLDQLLKAGEIDMITYLLQLNQTFEAETAALTLRGQLWGAWLAWLEASGEISRWVGR